MTTQSIVVYTPIEHALYNGGGLIPIMGGCAAAFLVFIAVMLLAEKMVGNHRVNNLMVGSAAIIALVAGALTFHWLFI